MLKFWTSFVNKLGGWRIVHPLCAQDETFISLVMSHATLPWHPGKRPA